MWRHKKLNLWNYGICRDIRELKHQTFLVPRTLAGSIFSAWQPLRMSRRSWVAATDFKTRVLRLKPEVQILGSSKSILHTKVEILRLKSRFLRKKETKLHANLWKSFSNELGRRSWSLHVGLLNDLHLARKSRPQSSSAWPAMPFVNQERLVLKFPLLKQHPKGLLAEKLQLWGKLSMWDISPVVLWWHHTNPSKYDLGLNV